ncbi:MAG: RluA family pseudouridine synthase [Deltaproteobacteria bacterium]|nr:RluA family pseudouridine synthase [Deltaproteobacteria bacterium]
MTPRCLHHTGTLLVLDKPSGMAVHRASGDESADLTSWAMEHYDAGMAPAHRLDRDTSGVVLLSSCPRERAELNQLFAQGDVHKTYLALVLGATRKKGVISRPLPDARRGRALDATTRYKRLEAFGSASLLEVRPETGRKHQIRRHLHTIGHPLVGDRRYRDPRRRRVFAFPGRLWLHACQLELPHGRVFSSPLPKMLTEHLELLRGLELADDA